MRRLRAGVIGGGFIGAQHVEAVRRLGYVDVAAIAGSSLDSARAGAKALQIERAYGSYAELLADPDIDVMNRSG
jgi:predicted dehydrogenase